MQLFDQANTLSNKHIKTNKQAVKNVPSGAWVECKKCQKTLFHKDLGEYHTCPDCGYGFRISAKERIVWLTDEFSEWDQNLSSDDPLQFPGYQEKLAQAIAQTSLNEAVVTGEALINNQKCALGVMDPNFIMGSLGTATGEKITRLFEKATAKSLPVVLYTASGGARMQEGIFSLMQMAKISHAVVEHAQKGLLYIVVLTDPTTGGVSASFAMQGDLILAEPHALIGFAGKRVIEQTMQQKIPDDLQDAENVLKNGFIDAIVPRDQQKAKISWLLKMHQ